MMILDRGGFAQMFTMLIWEGGESTEIPKSNQFMDGFGKKSKTIF